MIQINSISHTHTLIYEERKREKERERERGDEYECCYEYVMKKV